MTRDEFKKSIFKLEAFMKKPKGEEEEESRASMFMELYRALQGCSAEEFEKMTSKVQSSAKYFNNLTPADFWRARNELQKSASIAPDGRLGKCPGCDGTGFIFGRFKHPRLYGDEYVFEAVRPCPECRHALALAYQQNPELVEVIE